MNMISKMHPRLIGLAVATALSLGTNIGPASAAEYRLEAMGHASDGAVAVRLVDAATGQPVNNAQVFAIHTQYLPGKGEPRFLERRTALTPDGKGGFSYAGYDVQPGAMIRLVAHVDGVDIATRACVCA